MIKKLYFYLNILCHNVNNSKYLKYSKNYFENKITRSRKIKRARLNHDIIIYFCHFCYFVAYCLCFFFVFVSIKQQENYRLSTFRSVLCRLRNGGV